MSTSAVSSPSRSEDQTAWDVAVDRLDNFPASLEPLKTKDRNLLRGTTSPTDILELLQDLHSQQTVIRLPVIVPSHMQEPFSQFVPLLEVLTSVYPEISAPVLGAIKVILQLVIAMPYDAGRIETTLEHMLQTLKRFREVKPLSKRPCPNFVQWYTALERFYEDVINFTIMTGKYYNPTLANTWLRGLWKPVDISFGNVVSSMTQTLHSIDGAQNFGGVRTGATLGAHHKAAAALGGPGGYRIPAEYGRPTFEAIKATADCNITQEQYDAAIAWLRLVPSTTAAALETPLAAVSVVANAYHHLGRLDEALEWQQWILTAVEKAPGNDDLSTLNSVGNIGFSYSSLGRHDEALVWQRRTLAGKEKAFGSNHESTLRTVASIGITYLSLGQNSEALVWLTRALTGMEKTLGDEHELTLITVGNIACAYDSQGMSGESLQWNFRALRGKEKIFGKEHHSTLKTVGNIARVYRMRGQHSEALKYYEQSLAGFERVLGEEHVSTLAVMTGIGSIQISKLNYEVALAWRERALHGMQYTLGNEHPLTLGVAFKIAEAYGQLGKDDKALEWYEQAGDGMGRTYGKEHALTLQVASRIYSLRTQQKYWPGY